MAGRPLTLNDLNGQRIVECLKAGNTLTCAASTARVPFTTLQLWLRRGRKGEQPYADFLGRCNEAMTEQERVCVARVIAGEQGWQGAAWWLERYPKTRWRWRRPDNVTVAPIEKPSEDTLAMSDAELFAALAKEFGHEQGSKTGTR